MRSFLKLLKMYAWGGEDFFENDDNRDVSAAIILRFYKDIERNHNVQYATSGFIHLLAQTDNQELIRAILELEPLQKNNSAKHKKSKRLSQCVMIVTRLCRRLLWLRRCERA